MDNEEDDLEWQSGPFCKHWADYYECDTLCENCKEECFKHNLNECNCEEFK